MGPEQRTLLVCAHPDDETLGAGILMARTRADSIRILHVTDGSPRSLEDAIRAGCSTREEYAAVRRRELLNALELVGIAPAQCSTLGFVDQESMLHLTAIVERLSDFVDEFRPDVIYTHPYEGGHPDHDSCAFAVAQIDGLVRREFTSYHAGAEGLETGTFLHGSPEETILFTADERDLKRKMTACFASQQHVMALFGMDEENFRLAPPYDFGQSPHAGRLNYENWFAITGQHWRELASRALEQTGKKAVA